MILHLIGKSMCPHHIFNHNQCNLTNIKRIILFCVVNKKDHLAHNRIHSGFAAGSETAK